ncbi:hypothetical protein PXW92_07455 [Staphylococcus hominis]|uniref:hypothetical protein n=1 Tax=Staphylococcus hominis TaxID=1290 RepID=UPI0012DF90E3|nr:hypothetical protein [Staphylococcus hominis]MDS0981216.1 hypothetical protein [Staphylococcus hominis]QGR78696.1 hypothetical protein FOC54_01415 [Staphylococcus hominis]
MKEKEMKKWRTFFFWILGISILCVIALIIIGFISNFDNTNNDKFAGLCTLFAGILAITGVCFTIYNSQNLKNKELLNDLDQKSEWRKELMNVASKTFMTTNDIYRILASLRFIPKIKYNKKSEIHNFNHMTRLIYDELISMINDKYSVIIRKEILNLQKNRKEETKKIILDYKDTEIIRLYTKYLLKHHWEINIDETKWLKDQEKVIEEVKELRDTIQ